MEKALAISEVEDADNSIIVILSALKKWKENLSLSLQTSKEIFNLIERLYSEECDIHDDKSMSLRTNLIEKFQFIPLMQAFSSFASNAINVLELNMIDDHSVLSAALDVVQNDVDMLSESTKTFRKSLMKCMTNESPNPTLGENPFMKVKDLDYYEKEEKCRDFFADIYYKIIRKRTQFCEYLSDAAFSSERFVELLFKFMENTQTVNDSTKEIDILIPNTKSVVFDIISLNRNHLGSIPTLMTKYSYFVKSDEGYVSTAKKWRAQFKERIAEVNERNKSSYLSLPNFPGKKTAAAVMNRAMVGTSAFMLCDAQ